MHRATIAVVGLVLLTWTGAAATDQWPQFRGPNAGVIPDDPALPDTWSETSNVVWKTSIPGLGWSDDGSGVRTRHRRMLSNRRLIYNSRLAEP